MVTSYEPVKKRSDSYQSEAALEREFIQLLTSRATLNDYQFTDSEWEQFFQNAIANPNEHIVEKTRKIQEDFVQVLRRDDGTSKNYFPHRQEEHPQQPPPGHQPV